MSMLPEPEGCGCECHETPGVVYHYVPCCDAPPCREERETVPDDLEPYRQFWQHAQTFPDNKETVYPKHAEANGFDKQRGKLVFEYGCGGGADTMSLLRRGASVWYADIVQGNVRLATGRIRAQLGIEPRKSTESGLLSVPLVLDRSHPIPLPDERFDTVISIGVIHHIPEPAPVIAEFYRLLKPGGELYVMLYTESLWDRCKPLVDARAARDGITPERAFGIFTDAEGCPHATYYTVGTGSMLFADAGFEVEDFVEYNNGDFRSFHCRKPG